VFLNLQMQLYVDGACNDKSNKKGWASVCDQNEKDMIAEYKFLFNDLKVIEVDVPKGHKFVIESHFNDVASQQNNGAELIAMVCGLRIAKYLSQQCRQPNITDINQPIDLLRQKLPGVQPSNNNWQKPSGPPPPVIPKEGINFLARGPPQVNINSPMQKQMVQNGMGNSSINDDSIAAIMLQYQQQSQAPQQQQQTEQTSYIPQYAQPQLPTSQTGHIASTSAFNDDAIAAAMAELNMRNSSSISSTSSTSVLPTINGAPLLQYQSPLATASQQGQNIPQYSQYQAPTTTKQYQQQQRTDVAMFNDDAIAAAMAEMQNRSAPLTQQVQQQTPTPQISSQSLQQYQQQQTQQVPVVNNCSGLVVNVIYTDSDLIYQWWSKAHVSQKTKDAMDPEKLKKIYECADLLKFFNSKSGVVNRVSGDNNIADLGFHKPKNTGGWGNKSGYQKKSYGNNGYNNNYQQQGQQNYQQQGQQNYQQQGQQNYQQYQQSGYSQNAQGQPIIVLSNPYGQPSNMPSPFSPQYQTPPQQYQAPPQQYQQYQAPPQQYQAPPQQYQAPHQTNNIQPQFNILPQ
jgi:hypothetical protein